MATDVATVAVRGAWFKHTYPGSQPLPREPWAWRVDVEVADLSTPKRLAAVGLPAPAPGRHAWKAFQRIGERLWKQGWPGLLAPSAARPSGQILCLFRDEHGVRGAEPVPPPHKVTEPPPPPTGLQT